MSKKHKHKDEYDYSDIHYDGDVKKMLNEMGDVIESFASYMEKYAIFSCSEEEWEENRKLIKKLIKKNSRRNTISFPAAFDFLASLGNMGKYRCFIFMSKL